MEIPEIKVVSAVDFLTVTTKTDKESANMLKTLLDLLGTDFLTRSKSRDWSFMGYKGRAYEGVRYGLRREEAIVMLSGPPASKFWLAVAPARSRCTRIDLAVTVSLPIKDEYIAVRAYEGVTDKGQLRGSYIVNSLGGQTTYVGSRESQYFGRVYDKSAEQGEEPGRLWRFELEIKKPASEAIVMRLLTSQDLASDIYAYVATWFTSRGVGMAQFSTFTRSEMEIGTIVTTDEKSLNWLTTSVRPTVGRLIVNGLMAEVLDSLGLTKFVNIKNIQEEFDNGTR